MTYYVGYWIIVFAFLGMKKEGSGTFIIFKGFL